MYVEYKWMLLLSIILISLLAYLLVYYPSTMDFYVNNPFWNGYSDFSRLFNASTILTRADYIRIINGVVSNNTQRDVALVTIAYSNYTGQEIELLKNFVAGGGVLIILDDFSPSGNALLRGLGLEISINLSGVLIDPLYYYRDPHLPEVEGYLNNTSYRLVLNYASIIVGNINDDEIIIRSSSFSYLDLDNSSSWSPDEPTGPFAVGIVKSLGSGKIMIISDPSIWVNAMLPIGNNTAFAEAILAGKKVLLDQAHIPKSTQEILREEIFHTIMVLNSYGITPLIMAMFIVIFYKLFLSERWR